MKIDFLNCSGLSVTPTGLKSTSASVRYREIAPRKILEEFGHKARLIVLPIGEDPRGLADDWKSEHTDVISFGKISHDSQLEAVRAAFLSGAAINIDLCDLNVADFVSLPELSVKALSFAHSVSCPTKHMADILKTYFDGPIGVVGDPTLAPGAAPRVFDPAQRVVKGVWFGWTSNYPALRRWYPLLSAWAKGRKDIDSIDITVLGRADHLEPLPEFSHNKSGLDNINLSFLPWSEESAWDSLLKSDVCFLPSEMGPFFKVKSANRLVESLSMGCLPIAAPTPAYLEYADYALIGDDPGPLLDKLCSQPQAMADRVAVGRIAVQQRCSLEAVGVAWMRHFSQNTLSAEARRRRAGLDFATATQADGPIRLNLGCGDKVLDGFVNIDMVCQRGPRLVDVVHDVANLPFISDNAVDEILSVHVVEHFDRWAVDDVLREWLRVLKPGGRLILETPNLLNACAVALKYANHDLSRPELAPMTMWPFYGDPRWRDPLMTHRWLFSPLMLATLLRDCGFEQVTQEPAQFKRREPRDMRLVAFKPAS